MADGRIQLLHSAADVSTGNLLSFLVYQFLYRPEYS